MQQNPSIVRISEYSVVNPVSSGTKVGPVETFSKILLEPLFEDPLAKTGRDAPKLKVRNGGEFEGKLSPVVVGSKTSESAGMLLASIRLGPPSDRA